MQDRGGDGLEGRLTAPAYGLSGRGQWVTTSVNPSSAARPDISAYRSTDSRA